MSKLVSYWIILAISSPIFLGLALSHPKPQAVNPAISHSKGALHRAEKH